MGTSEEMIRENAGDALTEKTQSAGAKEMGSPDSNTGGVPDPSAPSGDAPNIGSVEQEQAAFIQEAEQAEAAFAGVGGPDTAAGVIESEADAPDQTQSAGGVDTDAPRRAREGEGAEGGDREYPEPSTGDMLASELGSEPSMQWEGKVAEKLAGSEGETTGTEKA